MTASNVERFDVNPFVDEMIIPKKASMLSYRGSVKITIFLLITALVNILVLI